MKPLAERIRPKSLKEVIGQKHLLGDDGLLMRSIRQKFIPSMILWGNPGIGKTTIAYLISSELDREMITLSATSAGVKDVREVLKSAEERKFFDQPAPILFIDEIHRFSKNQQDALLHAVEKGIVTLIGATTENPSFEINNALLSRCQVFTLEPLTREELNEVVDRALKEDEYLKELPISVDQTEALFQASSGDVRKLLNALETTVQQNKDQKEIRITDEMVRSSLPDRLPLYDKDGDIHYDLVSAFIKSIRGSNPDATLYWMARMLEGGEDVNFICRRMIISASEDIGLANPNALLMANSCMDAVHRIGMPEARIILSQCAVYLALSPKSNSTYIAINKAMEVARNTHDITVPLHLRNAPTKLSKQMGHGKNYLYPHDYPGNYVDQDYLPPDLKNEKFYIPQDNPSERRLQTKDSVSKSKEKT